MTNLPPTPLTTTAQRAHAAALVSGVLQGPSIRFFALVETLDAVSAAVLRTAGLDDYTSRAVLAALWEHPRRSAAAGEPVSRLRLTDRERVFLRGLGGRIHAVRRARRVELPAVRRLLSIPAEELVDLERGIAVPSILVLARLAEILQVPLPLLVDGKQTPADLLRQLAARERAGG